MKKLILKLFYFFSFSTILLFLIILLVVSIVKLGYKQDNNNISAESIIIGDSHTCWAIIGDSVPSTQNLSVISEGYIYSYAKLRYLLSNNTNIKRIYLGLSYHNLSSYFDEYIYGKYSSSIIGNYSAVLNFKDYLELAKFGKKKFFHWGKPLVKYGIKDILFTNGPDAIIPTDFPVEFLSQENKKDIDTDARITEQFYENNTVRSFSEINLKYLYKIVTFCKANNIEIIFLQTPLHNLYLEKIPPKYLEKYASVINDLGVSEINFRNYHFDDSMFLQDGDHLNYYGANYATKLFVELSAVYDN